ncbi:PE family protein [Mycobacterium ulcerans str. Harvey]|uniref:PE family protein n=1 Tax=Mycobacterium ulcerans str. Harvey TaxID=1299332 RepID=A0ABN0QUF4_MYCUL|nr:PE family protein [Mycobacterium ulcerans str. Harvey]
MGGWQMSFVIAVPDAVTAAVSDLANIGSVLTTANAAAALPATTVVAAAGDEISAAVAALFGSYAQGYQSLSAQAAAFHERFLQTLSGGAGAYAAAEAANASPLDQLMGVVNAPAQALLGRPLIGNGANGADGTGAAGGDGGILLGNGAMAARVRRARSAGRAARQDYSAMAAPGYRWRGRRRRPGRTGRAAAGNGGRAEWAGWRHRVGRRYRRAAGFLGNGGTGARAGLEHGW